MIARSVLLFVLAAVAEIGGAYLKRHPKAKIRIVLEGTFTGADGTVLKREIVINVRRLRR